MSNEWSGMYPPDKEETAQLGKQGFPEHQSTRVVIESLLTQARKCLTNFYSSSIIIPEYLHYAPASDPGSPFVTTSIVNRGLYVCTYERGKESIEQLSYRLIKMEKA